MARVRLPILVTTSKLLVTDEDGDITTSSSIGESVMDFASDVLLTITSREEGGEEVDVYLNETGGTPLGVDQIRTDGRGRFEGWIERGRINVTATVGNLSFSDDFDLAPASDGSVDSNWIASGAVTEDKLDQGAVTTNKLGNSSVTLDKIANSAKDQAAGTPSLRSLGTGATQAAPGNDSRFENSRPPSGSAGGDLSGTFPNPQIASGVIVNSDISSSANISESKLNLASDAAAGTASRRTLGSGSTQAAPGNDGRFPTTDQKAALAGATTGGSPSAANRYVTSSDSRFGLMVSAENPLNGSGISTNSIPTNRVQTRGTSGDTGLSLSQLATEVLNVVVPVGAILPFGGASAPAGFLLCNGSSYSISTYSALNTILGGAYNIANQPSGTFSVPNLSNRFLYGGTRGAREGTSDVKLSETQIPLHSHTAILTGKVSGWTQSAGNHFHYTNGNRVTTRQGNLSGTVITNLGGTGLNDSGTTNTTGSHQHEINLGVTVGVDPPSQRTGNYGGNDTHTNMPPWVGVNYIIKF